MKLNLVHVAGAGRRSRHGRAPAMAQQNTASPQLTLSSPTVKDMEPLPLKYSQTGTRPSIVVPPGMNNGAVNPPLEWSNVPAGNECLRPDRVRSRRHFDVGRRQYSRERAGIARGYPEWKRFLEAAGGCVSPELPKQRLDRTAARKNPEGRWTYYWKLYPLDRKLNVPEDASREDILAAMEGHLTGNKAVMITPCCDGSN